MLATYIFIGAITGVIAGLLGVGGGLIVVPALAALFSAANPDNPWLMQTALGTSLATIIPTSISSLVAHFRHGAIRVADVNRLAPGLVGGALAGAWLASRIDTQILKTGFGLFVLLVAAQMLSGFRPDPHDANGPRTPAGAAIGLVSALAGIGGGSMTVPYLVWKGRGLREAIATSAACGLPIALAATLGFVITGMGKTGQLSGFIDPRAFLAISAASILTAPLGARLAHTLPVPTVKRVFAIFLVAVGLKMIFR
ncbi:MAG: sulfite exporter TauE/SafE family protein [Gammaproteobacteria bacterium]|nr:MAG: sulfite exporter TauE/SafE family protein [Gammaproteobacteria bacterium]